MLHTPLTAPDRAVPARYDGAYGHGRRHGKGKYTFKSGTTYEGDYVNNAKVRALLLAAAELKSAAASVKPDDTAFAQHGTGVMNYADGSSYEGSYKIDKRHGQGTYTYVNGDVYAGGWADGVKHGKGCYFFAATKCQFLGFWEGAKFTAGTVRCMSPPPCCPCPCLRENTMVACWVSVISAAGFRHWPSHTLMGS
jgi:hypothetical protein